MNLAYARTLFAVAALGLSCAGFAADKKAETGKASKDDREFIMDVANDGLAEVELGRIAQQKGQSEDVKKFGQRMVDDHSKANQELEGIAGKLGVNLPKEPSGKHAKLVKELSKKDKRFDHEYAEAMVKDHEKAVKLFEMQSKKADSRELREFAASTLPTLKEHLQMAKNLKNTAK